MAYNIFIIILILAGIGYLGYRYYKTLTKESSDEYEDIGDSGMDIESLRNTVAREFANQLKSDFKERNQSRKEYEAARRKKALLMANLKEAAYGNVKAKRAIKLMIRNMLTSEQLKIGVNEENIDGIIPFNNYEELSDIDKFEIVTFICSNKLINKTTGKLYRKAGFLAALKKYDLLKAVPVKGEMIYDFTSQKLDFLYNELIKEYPLDFNSKLEILTQRVFEMYKGLGIVDILFETNIDEVAAGLSGIPKGSYEIETEGLDALFSYQSVWCILSGNKTRFSCLDFGSQQELERVVTNIYKYGANKTLSKKTGYVISTMNNGSRVVVWQPPFANGYAFIARKFDSTESIAPENLIKGKNNIIPITLMKWFIKGEKTIPITGDQGTGKSTMLKSLIRFINPNFAIRVQEIAAELNLNYCYPNRNIVAFQETEHVKSQEGLNLQKKSSGDVNIIGEVTEAIQANYVIQTSMIASRFTMFTGHHKTAYDLIMGFANNLLDPVCGIYREKKEAVEMAAKVLNIDCHLANVKGKRFMERITEIIPDYDFRYPTDIDPLKYTHEDDEKEYFRRMTDRIPFTTVNLMRYDIERDEFILEHLPSKKMMAEIIEKLDRKEEAEFKKDMKMLVEIAKQAKKEREAEALRTKRNESMGKAKKNMENFLDPDFFEDIVEPLDELDGEPPCSGNFQPAY